MTPHLPPYTDWGEVEVTRWIRMAIDGPRISSDASRCTQLCLLKRACGGASSPKSYI